MRDMMERIDLEKFADQEYDSSRQIDMAIAVNEIMDFMEKNVPVRNGKLFHCLNCGHNTGYPGDLDCCSSPSWVVL